MSSSRPNGERNPRSRPLLIGDLASSAAAGLDLPRTLTVDEDDPSSQITDSEAEDDDTEVDLDDAEDTLVNDSDRLDGGPNTPSRKRTYVRTFPELSPAEERDVKQILFQRLKRGDLKLDYELKVAMNIAAPRDDFDDDDDDKEEEEEEEGENNAEGRANDAMEEIDVNKEILPILDEARIREFATILGWGQALLRTEAMKDKIEYDASHKAPALAARIVLFRLRLERHDNNPHSKLYNALIACARENGQRLKEAYACRTAGGYLVTSTDIVGIRQGVLRGLFRAHKVLSVYKKRGN